MSKIIPLDGKWKPRTWYRGKCSLRPGNPRFEVLVYSGFLDKNGRPGNYSGVFAANTIPDEPGDIFSVYGVKYLEITQELFEAGP